MYIIACYLVLRYLYVSGEGFLYSLKVDIRYVVNCNNGPLHSFCLILLVEFYKCAIDFLLRYCFVGKC